ncbi:MAG TPA: DUF371 domain-containing protein [archaeon]|nr:DUF371 domain-containing protein [archaeon]
MTEEKNYEVAEGGPNITPEMIRNVHQTLETRGLLYYSEGKIYVPTEKGWRLLTDIKPVREEIHAHGHPDITATSETVIGFTKLENLHESKEKHGIIGVKASKSSKELSDSMRDSLKGASKVHVIVEIDDVVAEKFTAYGSPALKLNSEEEIIIRKNDDIHGNTAVIMADKASMDINREFVEKLKNPHSRIKIILEIK